MTDNFKFSTRIIFWAILFGNNIKGEVLALFSYNFDSKSHDYIMVTIWQMTNIEGLVELDIDNQEEFNRIVR